MVSVNNTEKERLKRMLRAIHTAKPPVTPWSKSVRPECAACEWRRDGVETCILPRCMKC